jgi:hypothetical protein
MGRSRCRSNNAVPLILIVSAMFALPSICIFPFRADLKNQIGLLRLRLLRIKHVREQFFLAATAQNIKRLVRFLSNQPQQPATGVI